LTSPSIDKAPSTELAGGAGFSYENMVAAYYLAALLRREGAAGLDGTVVGVAVQQHGQGNPMDDVVVDFNDAGKKKTLGLQIKRSVTISASSDDFQAIVRAAVATQAKATFKPDVDAAGFVVENVANQPFQNLDRLIKWAKASPVAQDFENRFSDAGAASVAAAGVRENLKPLIGAPNLELEVRFYRHFTAIGMNNLAEGAAGRAEILNRLNEAVTSNEDGQNILLFDRLCQVAREGAAVGARWTRETLLAKLHGKIRLRIAPNLLPDIEKLNAFSLEGLRNVSDTIDGFHVERAALQKRVHELLKTYKLVSISGLPGCGKSAVLKHFAEDAAKRGPILFLKSDRIEATGWTPFAAALGLQHTAVTDLLAEIGATGTPILFIDGIDRLRPDRRGVVTDLLQAIESDPSLSHWKVLATSRDQGLETYSAWFPASFYKHTGIGDLQVSAFSDKEAEALAKSKPSLRKVLFGNQAVSQVARRPFFAAVLARTIPASSEPQTEVDLINAWWDRAGHHTDAANIPQRQRALLDIAEKGARNLGKSIPTRQLSDATNSLLEALKDDYIIRFERGGANIAFSHDIFFEWSFFRLLIDLDDKWTSALELAGEAPLLGRVVGLMAQETLARPGEWTKGYAALAASSLRMQWRREWLTAPPFTSAFAARLEEFAALMMSDDWALFDKLLVWFQAQHTTPSPLVLAQPPIEGQDNIRMADLLGWPSDGHAWGSLIDWLVSIADKIPVRLIPAVLEVFGVWQNIACDFQNPRSAALLEQTDKWLKRWESGKLTDGEPGEAPRYWRYDDEAQVSKTLRQLLLVSARSYPDYAKELFARALKNKDMRRRIFPELMAFSPFMAQVAPELLAQVAESQILEELPEDRLIRQQEEREETYRARDAVRAIPEDQRTEQQNRMLAHSPFIPYGRDRIDFDDIGIERHNNFYYPESPVHEPFASLFTHKPEVALKLVRTLANHATKGWRQVYSIRKEELGAPLPVKVAFPWGEQIFWGNARVFSWANGQWAPNPLDCAFLALRYWAFKQLEAGRTASELIKEIVEGNECYAILGVALTLALETCEMTETTLAVATCQRLWHHDIRRAYHEPMKNLDIFGIGQPEFTRAQKHAQAFLDSRQSRRREVRQLAVYFAVVAEEPLREKYKAALAKFPDDLPFEIEEHRANEGAVKFLKEEAERWSELGKIENYRNASAPDGKVAIYYEHPKPFTPEQQKRLEESTQSLTGYSVQGWATGYLEEGKAGDNFTLLDAVKYARSKDGPSMFSVLAEPGDAEQPAIASVAACVIRFEGVAAEDVEWAWDVMFRIEKMKERERDLHGARMNWHPATRLALALQIDRRSAAPRADTAERLLRLAVHPSESVSECAFRALFLDSNDRVKWVAGQLAIDFCIHYRDVFKDGEWQPGENDAWQEKSLNKALERLRKGLDEAMSKLPPAWIKGNAGGRRKIADDEWQYPEPSFAPQFGKNILNYLPVEAWLASATYRPLFEPFLLELVQWTEESVLPSWRDKSKRKDRRTDLFEWARTLGDMLARAAPFFSFEDARAKFLVPFLPDDEDALAVISAFADRTATRHVMDAKVIPDNTIPLLAVCVQRVTSDRAFVAGRYRAGEIYGYPMPELIRTLFFVAVSQHCPGAERFANGDWSDIGRIMPLVEELVTKCGWVPFIIQNYLTLCERASVAFPAEDFARQANAALANVKHAEGKWTGTTNAARIAGVVQRLADHNFPLQQNVALELLKVLDALIDLGDRRSAALEQTEAFKGVQARKLS
jgi:hypothetical protein